MRIISAKIDPLIEFVAMVHVYVYTCMCVAVCCSVLQCVTVCCSVLHCGTVGKQEGDN